MFYVLFAHCITFELFVEINTYILVVISGVCYTATGQMTTRTSSHKNTDHCKHQYY